MSTLVKVARVIYHYEACSWWAESDDLVGWTAAANSFEGVRDLARAAVRDAGYTLEEVGVPTHNAHNGAA